jgi:hypothetical protein
MKKNRQMKKERYLFPPSSPNPKLKKQPLKFFLSLAMITFTVRILRRKRKMLKGKISEPLFCRAGSGLLLIN